MVLKSTSLKFCKPASLCFHRTVIAFAISLSAVTSAMAQENIPDDARDLKLFGEDWKNLQWVSEFGQFIEIKRDERKPVDTEKQEILPVARDDGESEPTKQESLLPVDQLKDIAQLEFFDIDSNRTFSFDAKQSDLAFFLG